MSIIEELKFWGILQGIRIFSKEKELVCGKSVHNYLLRQPPTLMNVCEKGTFKDNPNASCCVYGKYWYTSNFISDEAIIPLSKFKKLINKESVIIKK